jgi:nitrous oxidase accessory protein
LKHILTILLITCTTAVFARTITVGKHAPIKSLKEAVRKANAGDTIYLQAGIYKEGNIVIDKPLKLIGIGNPVLDGEKKYEILTITGQRVLVKGIEFRNSGYSSMNDYASISVIDAQDVLIENNKIVNAYFAIHLANTINSVVRNNIISSTPRTEQTSGNGVHLWKCDNILVKNNRVEGHRDGIYFEFVSNSVIEKNYSTKNIRYGLHFMFSNSDSYVGNTFKDNGAGVAVMYSKDVLMLENFFDHNWGPNAYGLLLKEISDARIFSNKFDKNTVGILMESTNRIDVTNNTFRDNGWAMRIQASCNENTVGYNDFYSNTFDVATNGSLSLNKFYSNYWDKYEGYDINKDGVGDVPYHPTSMYSMVIEQNPNALILLRSFMVNLLDKAEKAIPSLTPENLVDDKPLMKRIHNDNDRKPK